LKNEENINHLTAHLFRENSGKMVAVLSRLFGLHHIDTVMDVVQDTFESVLTQWRFSGVPDNPSAWLMKVAKNKAINALKRENKTKSFSPSLYLTHFDDSFENQFDILLSPKEIQDSQLRLLFACCLPDLSQKNQVILTLHILCGFGVPEIANAMLMNNEAVKKVIARSKDQLKELNNILQTRLITLSEERIQTVHTILYLMFNEGYKTTRSKKGINNDLCYEAIRLAKLLDHKNAPRQHETQALLALMFLNISRFPARVNMQEEWLTLEEQDRSKWDKVFIEEGYYYLNKAVGSKSVTRFHIEAIIASLHCSASSFEKTNWEEISKLYRILEQLEPSGLVKLNRIMAESYISNSKSIQAIDKLKSNLLFKDNFLLSAAKGDVYQRKGQFKNSLSSYEEALQLAVSPADKKFLKKKISQYKQNQN
jgi:RNA polymerase sigma-70 factor (ECF subfamily)